MRDINKFNWKKHLLECINSTEYCCIATVDENSGVWSNPVYFAWDDNFNLYFISQLPSRHMTNLAKDSRISVSIYKTEQKGDVAGIQLEGIAQRLTLREDISRAFKVYHGRTGGGHDQEQYINNPTWHFVQITPKQIYYFDTRFFEEERQEVPFKDLF
jgi:general stress protein 26